MVTIPAMVWFLRIAPTPAPKTFPVSILLLVPMRAENPMAIGLARAEAAHASERTNASRTKRDAVRTMTNPFFNPPGRAEVGTGEEQQASCHGLNPYSFRWLSPHT